jgi:mono/diheme cytochrome c family protein/predicted enzyme related to lactoylglutathione lyase
MKLRLLAPVALIAAVVVLATINLTAEAEPSWLERTLAFGLLQARIALSGTPKAVPSDSNDKRSREIYQQRCASCHGGIDGTTASFAHALSPRPPQFFAEPPRASVAADAYIIKHGIRWTGMPAFRTMSDADAWRVATYVRHARRDTIVDPLFGLRPYLAGIYVRDADSAARWYQDNLGFTKNGESTVNGLREVVVERGPYAIEMLSAHDAHALGVSKLGFVVDDLDPVLRELQQRGVHIVRGITSLPAFQIRFLLIQDPNGNVIQLFDRRT